MKLLTKLNSYSNFLQLEKFVIGIEETIFIKGIGSILAKVDSGNGAYNVINGYDLVYTGDNVIFTTTDDEGQVHRVFKKVQDKITINLGAGYTEERPIVLFDVKFGQNEYLNVPFTVGNRENAKNKVLLGKEFLIKKLNALIDVTAKDIADQGIEVDVPLAESAMLSESVRPWPLIKALYNAVNNLSKNNRTVDQTWEDIQAILAAFKKKESTKIESDEDAEDTTPSQTNNQDNQNGQQQQQKPTTLKQKAVDVKNKAGSIYNFINNLSKNGRTFDDTMADASNVVNAFWKDGNGNSQQETENDSQKGDSTEQQTEQQAVIAQLEETDKAYLLGNVKNGNDPQLIKIVDYAGETYKNEELATEATEADFNSGNNTANVDLSRKGAKGRIAKYNNVKNKNLGEPLGGKNHGMTTDSHGGGESEISVYQNDVPPANGILYAVINDINNLQQVKEILNNQYGVIRPKLETITQLLNTSDFTILEESVNPIIDVIQQMFILPIPNAKGLVNQIATCSLMCNQYGQRQPLTLNMTNGAPKPVSTPTQSPTPIKQNNYQTPTNTALNHTPEQLSSVAQLNLKRDPRSSNKLNIYG